MGRKQNAQCQILDIFYFLKKRKEARKEARSDLKSLHTMSCWAEAQVASGRVLSTLGGRTSL